MEDVCEVAFERAQQNLPEELEGVVETPAADVLCNDDQVGPDDGRAEVGHDVVVP